MKSKKNPHLSQIQYDISALHSYDISTIGAIKDVVSYSNSRLKIVLAAPPDKEDVLVSREKVESFKECFGK